jgi:hypothetical protein
MAGPDSQQWFLRKQEDGSTFGPLSFTQLAQWASSAQVAPNDSISADQSTWIKAPMLPELGMDWIVEVTTERYYGPTTLGAINEFIRLGEIHEDTRVINACDGTRHHVRDLALLLHAEPAVSDTSAEDAIAMAVAGGPGAVGMAIGVQDRIRELEQALREERRALAEAEERYRDLEQRYLELMASRSAL